MTTIFAPATPPGRSALAVIRISGPQARKFFSSFGLATSPQPRKATLVTLRHPDSAEPIDQVLLVWFPAPHSFTGEDTLELSLHGSPAVRQQMLSLLSAIPDYRLAKPGEFSERAFRHGKMDLLQVEAIHDMIEAETEAQRRQAMHQLEGKLSLWCQDIRARLILARAQLEACLDFPDEDIPPEVMAQVMEECAALRSILEQTLRGAARGERIRNGVNGVILGVPNAGKSSLLNALAGRDVAIVSERAGTTRDVIEIHLDLGGYPLILADTAGLRETEDPVEREGIRRARARAEHADLRLWLLDSTQSLEAQRHLLPSVPSPYDVVILHKSDLLPPHLEIEQFHDAFHVSSLSGQGLDDLLQALKSRIESLMAGGAGDALLTRQRHRVAFEQALHHVALVESQTIPELQCEELRRASEELSSVIGTIHHEEILDALFCTFCIGK